MAVTNFRKEDFPKGKKAKEQRNAEREDNKILDVEVDHAVRDEKEGEKFAKDFAEKDAAAEEKLADEVKNTVEDGTNEQQTAEKTPTRKRSTKATKAAKAADEHIEAEVEKTSTTATGSKPTE